ncbi:MAG: hypothetical protein K2P14_10420 [Anaeroplasmataceae bacterium]|nr:hypothetical protein [Anaeroplasmataceae bacterium]
MNVHRIRINKNRGWRGLAEVICEDLKGKELNRMIFSFSQAVWDNMLDGFIVLQDNEHYFVLNFGNTDELPKPTQQRSVLIKQFIGPVKHVWTYSKNEWSQSALTDGHYDKISNFIRNRNNHTTSDWNCIGIRVIPII